MVEILAWVRLQLGTACCVDTDRYYEHWELRLARFQEFKLRVQASKDKYFCGSPWPKSTSSCTTPRR